MEPKNKEKNQYIKMETELKEWNKNIENGTRT